MQSCKSPLMPCGCGGNRLPCGDKPDSLLPGKQRAIFLSNGSSSMFGSPRYGGNNPKRLLIHNLSLNLRRAMKFIRHNATGASAITVR